MRLAAAILLIGATPAFAAPMAAHTATYHLSLKDSPDQSVMAATGTMTYDVTDTCAAWATAQHLVIDLTNKDGQEIKMVSDYATLEDKDGRHLDFHTKQVTDTAVTQQLDGTATIDHSGRGTADFTNPDRRQLPLPPGTLLPMAHTSALIDAAIAGRKFLAVPLFDGTDAGGAQDTFVTIENWGAGGAKPPATPGWPQLASMPSGHVHIAFFDRTKSAETPNYEIGLHYFLNGVASGLTMNFGDFAMDGVLSHVERHAAPPC